MDGEAVPSFALAVQVVVPGWILPRGSRELAAEPGDDGFSARHETGCNDFWGHARDLVRYVALPTRASPPRTRPAPPTLRSGEPASGRKSSDGLAQGAVGSTVPAVLVVAA